MRPTAYRWADDTTGSSCQATFEVNPACPAGVASSPFEVIPYLGGRTLC